MAVTGSAPAALNSRTRRSCEPVLATGFQPPRQSASGMSVPLLDRVAQGIYAHDGHDKDEWATCPSDIQAIYRDEARVAIEAMRAALLERSN